MKTASFATYTGPGRICIARFTKLALQIKADGSYTFITLEDE